MTDDLEKRIITKCCVCGKVEIDGNWLYQHIPENQDVLYSHGYCPDDYLKALRELK
jgi:hypothetical protein